MNTKFCEKHPVFIGFVLVTMPRLSEDERNRALGMLQAGMSKVDVARHFGCHRNTIQALWRRFQQLGNVRDRPRPGRPRVTSRRQDNHIRLVHLRNRFQSSSLTARTIPGLRRISSRTVRNRLRQRNIRPRRPAVRPVLLQRHRTARLACARRHLRFRFNDWTGVLFTDESRFHLDGSDGRCRVYRRPGERYSDACVVQRQTFGGGSVMVWGGITRNGRTPLQLVNGNLTGIRYRDEILQRHVIPFIQNQGRQITLQQDNARPHVARVVRNFLNQQNVDVLPWPAVSPNLSPIEHLWDEMERRLRDLPNPPVTLQEVGPALVNIWNNIPQAFLDNLVSSMRRRCRAVIDANGGHTRY